MTKLLAIDWDSKELRCARGDATGGCLRKAECVARSWDAAEAAGLAAGSFEAVTMLLRQEGVAGARGLLVACREHFETFNFTVPPCSDHDLADLVENHVAVEQTLGAEALIYDFIPAEAVEDAPRRVIAVAMDQDVVARYRNVAEESRLKRPQLLVRGEGAAAVYARLVAENTEPVLLVVPMVEEVDLVFVADGKARYWRTVHCSTVGPSESFREFIATEVLRTLAVVSEELRGDRRVSRVAAFVAEGEASGVLGGLKQVLDIPLDRLDVAPQNVDVVCQAEGSTGRFAPLVGSLLSSALDESPRVDLFRRRRRSTPQAQQRPRVLLAAAAAIAVMLGISWMWDQVDRAQSETLRLARELKQYQQEAEKYAAADATLKDLAAWRQSSVVWLDELRDLTLKFAPPGDAVVLDFAASPNPTGGATVRINGRTRDPAVVTQLDQTLRDEYRVVLSDNFREESAAEEERFGWRFESMITTLPRSPAEYRKELDEWLPLQSAVPSAADTAQRFLPLQIPAPTDQADALRR